MKLYVRTRSGKPPTSKLASNLSFIIIVLHIKAKVSIWKEWVGWIIHKSGIVIMTLVQLSFYVYPFLVIRDPTSPPNWFAPQTLVRDRQSLGLTSHSTQSFISLLFPARSVTEVIFVCWELNWTRGRRTFEIISTLEENFLSWQYQNVNISRRISKEFIPVLAKCCQQWDRHLFNQQSETAHPDLPVLNLILNNANSFGPAAFSQDLGKPCF